MSDQPPSTITELRQVFIDFEAQRPRSMQKALGPSELGGPCAQQIARKLAGAPEQPTTTPAWAPFQGIALHEQMAEEVLPFWNRQLGRERWLPEDELVVDDGEGRYPVIKGRSDAFDQDHGTVVDWKLTGVTAIKALAAAKRAGKPPAEQVSPVYRAQGHLYGRGQELKGRTVRFVRLVFLVRGHDFDQSEEWTEAYRPDVAAWAINRYRLISDAVAALDLAADPDAITTIAANPGNCGFCRFRRPGQPAGWGGCPGDVEAAARSFDRFGAGVI